MYSKFFGFKEKPFMQAPNPAYLFLGKSHEEALAHLIYAVSEGEGFISLIGKRGVGKTTICRAFIDRREEKTEVAYIFKPEVSPEELLKTINSEFSISANSDDVKELIDALNSFLMQKRVAGKKVLLFIDDAQNLKADALEQVRLLSNLETTREKLLQIVLVGELRLADMLGSHALRQIGQRVSVSYYINPLTYEETCAYIYHRLRIASLGAQTHFEASALKRIYNFSGGVPRMINTACDKSLFTAHRLNHSHITGAIAKTAILNLSRASRYPRSAFLTPRWTVLALAGGCLLLFLMVVAFFPWRADRQAAVTQAEGRPAVIQQPERPKVVAVSRTASEPAATVSRASGPEVLEAGEPVGKPGDTATANPVIENPPEPSAKMTHSVQVGAFSKLKPAQELVATFKQKDYPAGILPVTDSRKRIWYTIRIGDYSSWEAAIQHANEFTARENLAAAVRPFEKL